MLLVAALAFGSLFIAVVLLHPERHRFPAGDLASQTATATVEAYVEQGDVVGDRVSDVRAENRGVRNTSFTYWGSTYKNPLVFAVEYRYQTSPSEPAEDRRELYYVGFDSKKNQWVIVGGYTAL